MSPSPTVLVVLDGWGHRSPAEDNAIHHGHTPTWDALWGHRPRTLISSSGTDVGLPSGQMGNSEVGHMNLGAGRIVDQDFRLISRAIDDGSFTDNPVLASAVDTAAKTQHAVHILGLLSPGGVHSHEDHVAACVRMAFERGAERVWVHAFLDGRDVPPKSAAGSIARLEDLIRNLGDGGIASVCGRFYAMDRDNRWERVAAAWRSIAIAEGEQTAVSATAALQEAYARKETDEFVAPTVIGKGAAMVDGDTVIFMNFRADRARELSRVFTETDFNEFERPAIKLAHFVTLTEYASDLDAEVAFKPEFLDNVLGKYLSDLGRTQLRLAETEKYAHVTFFLNGGREAPFNGEERIMIPSPKVETYDLVPEMSAPEVTDALVDAITGGQYDLIVCNYANGDMVGHTGVFDAAVKAVECLDTCLTRVVAAIESVNGHLIITADHGNAEQMSDNESGQAHTAHTSEPVPCVYVGNADVELANGGRLCDIAPTLLALMGLPKPCEMTGRTLIKNNINAGVAAD